MKEALFAVPKAPPRAVTPAPTPAQDAFLEGERPSPIFVANAPPAPRQARLSVDLPASLLRALKVRAAERGVSIRELVLSMLEREGLNR